MKRRLDAAVFSRILGCYAALGRRVPALGAGLHHSHCERWRNATMSPFFLSSKQNLQRQLMQAESYFRRHRSKHPYDAHGAYANLLGVDAVGGDRRTASIARGLGWEVDPRPGTLNAWNNLRPVVLMKSFHLVTGRYFDRSIHRGFKKTMAENFGTKPKFLHQLDEMMRGIEERVRTVLLYHESGKIAGGGLVATREANAFLFCGSIVKPYRGKGLWNALVATRQMVSAQQGAEFWITTTRTQSILGKGDFSYPMTVLSKKL